MTNIIKITVYKIKKCGLEQFEVRVNGTLHCTVWSLDKAKITVNTLKQRWEHN